jgi:putative holliday junction resolvase
MRLLGIDLGSKRIGIAVSDALGFTAHPVTVLNRQGGQADLNAISDLVEEHEVGQVVLGLPLNMDDSEGAAAARVRRFGESLQRHLGIPVHLWDERLTTWEALQMLKQAQVKPRKRRKVVDQLAAVLILGSYMEAHREEGA